MASGKIIIRPRKVHDSTSNATLVGPSRLEVRTTPGTPTTDRDPPTNDSTNTNTNTNDNEDNDDDNDDEDAPTTNAATPMNEGADDGSGPDEPVVEDVVPYASAARTPTRPWPRCTHRQRTRRTCTGAWTRARTGAGLSAVGVSAASRSACRGAVVQVGTVAGGAGGDEDSAAATGGEEGTPGVEGGVLHDEEVMGGGKPFSIVQGKVYVIEGDEFVTEDDAKGDTKIDRNGNLLGGACGFRDSLYYFRRNPLAHKLNATPSEKEYLIEIGKLGSHLRTRSVTLITARSAFKLHGAKTLIDGRWVVDDYYEDKVLADITEKGLKPGDPVGELADPNAPGSTARAGPTTLFGSAGWGPYSDGPLNAVRKSLLNRDGLNEENWMLTAAQRTADASAEWAKQRRRALVPYGGIFGATPYDVVAGKVDGRRQAHGDEQDQGARERREDESAATGAQRRKRARLEEKVPRGVYEPHIGIVLYRTDTQPTRARWEGLKDSADKATAWALAWVDTVMEIGASEGDDHEAGRTAGEERRRLLELAAADLNS
ncbi:chromatin remodelling complex Rsc7/Swp82 subunit-domain-containing protein [Lactarius deliciosus]|nr:chromatin remodelling complex Rsc7/Swp82 subunit-domain-containing protein [Lactarius deliciosus]